MTTRTVLLTGAAGGLGSVLVPAFQRSGWRVRALVHRRPVPTADETALGDVLEPETLVAAAEGVQAVVHAAAVTHARDPRRYGAVNVRGTEAVVASAERAGVERLLLLSSHALGEGGGAYSDSKRRSEDVVRSGTIPFTIVRLPEVYGVGGREGIERMIAAAQSGRLVLVVGAGGDVVCPVHVDDVVNALVRALETPAAVDRTYTLAGPALTLGEVAEISRSTFGSTSRILAVPESLVEVAARLSRVLPLPLYPDQLDRLRAPRPEPSPEAEAELGFHPAPLSERLLLSAAPPDVLSG